MPSPSPGGVRQPLDYSNVQSLPVNLNATAEYEVPPPGLWNILLLWVGVARACASGEDGGSERQFKSPPSGLQEEEEEEAQYEAYVARHFVPGPPPSPPPPVRVSTVQGGTVAGGGWRLATHGQVNERLGI